VTTAGSTAEIRNRRRRALAFARLAELREGTWLRPANLDLPLGDEFRQDVTCFSARPDEPEALIGRLWDLEAWRARSDQLLGRLADLPPSTPGDLAPGFVLSADVLRHLQHDPLLPAGLAPPGWPGPRLRRVYASWDRRYRELLARWGRGLR
jgi:phenylacetic acid degradation operon negative regulatory protein